MAHASDLAPLFTALRQILAADYRGMHAHKLITSHGRKAYGSALNPNALTESEDSTRYVTRRGRQPIRDVTPATIWSFEYAWAHCRRLCGLPLIIIIKYVAEGTTKQHKHSCLLCCHQFSSL
eukprot:752498-Amphidinium_carterae.2